MPIVNNEAKKIYKAIFNKDIPLTVQEHFNAVSGKIESRFTDQEISKYFEIIKKVHDLEALELAARSFGKLTIITLKFKVMLYLAETQPENYSRYINEKDNFILGFSLLILSMLRSSFKLLKGLCFIYFYRI